MDMFPTNEDHGIVDRVARDRAPQASALAWVKSLVKKQKGDQSAVDPTPPSPSMLTIGDAASLALTDTDREVAKALCAAEPAAFSSLPPDLVLGFVRCCTMSAQTHAPRCLALLAPSLIGEH